MMNDRRMVSNRVIKCDKFVKMSVSARLLYINLLLDADDEGFVVNPRSTLRMTNVRRQTLDEVINGGWVLKFDFSDTLLIKHWSIHNSVRKDRIRTTFSYKEKELVKLNENGEYEWKTPEELGCQLVDKCPPKRKQEQEKYKEKESKEKNGNDDVAQSASEAQGEISASAEEVGELFDISINSPPTHSISKYRLAKKEFDRSSFCQQTIKSIKALDKQIDRIIAGQFTDYRKPPKKDHMHDLMPQTYTDEEINSVFLDVTKIDIDNLNI